MTPDQVLSAVDAAMSRPFAWGDCDCCSAACDVFERLHGFDPMPQWRWVTGERAALRIIRDHGGLERLADQTLTDAGLVPGDAPGGLALSVDQAARQSLMICISRGLWAGKTKTGFALMRRAARGWRVA